MFHRKFKFPLILTTDSKSVYDIRSARDIASFFKSIGFTDKEIYDGLYYYPKQIIDFNKERENMIVRGVKVIEGADDFTDTYDKMDSDLEEFDTHDFDGLMKLGCDDFDDLEELGSDGLDDLDFEDEEIDFKEDL